MPPTAGPAVVIATAGACAARSRRPRCRWPPAARRRSRIWCRTPWSGWSVGGRELADIDFLVLEVPRLDAPGAGWSDEPVPLGGTVPTHEGHPARVVVYRRPVEIRTKGRDERAALVHEVVVEQVAELLGLTPETVDPRYGED
ncbi:hypothetical protein SHIRM173S_08115 [Streptomyces hirsutus]